jgi:hypothetical protein
MATTTKSAVVQGNGAHPLEIVDENSGPSVFDNLDSLRISPESAGLIGMREVLRHVPVRKPNRTDFFRVHPAADMTLATGVYIDREERETYVVAPELQGSLTLYIVTGLER